MYETDRKKDLILIADDSEMNRSILTDMLGEEYDIIEAENGVHALSLIKLHGNDLSLILLDIVMPEADGFEVLERMNEEGWINKVPVIMISAENRSSAIERAYELGVTDFIGRPFDSLIVHRRVINTILLYTKQKKLIEIAAKQIYEKERQSLLMIEILSHIVEFRNGESGRHVRKVRIFTEMLLNELTRKTKYKFSHSEISTISTASALHDIGKMGISEKILNKPGKLTDEEFEEIKKHSIMGAKMLLELPIQDDNRLIETAYEICRWHHERYDGKGYPDGLKGDAIPISAQVVALVDVYDALTSDRVYKKAISHENALKMIVNGECGKFNPVIVECFIGIKDELEAQIKNWANSDEDINEARSLVEELLQHDEMSVSNRTIQLLENERMKLEFFASLTKEIQFEYTVDDSVIVLSPSGAELLNFPETIVYSNTDKRILSVISEYDLNNLSEMIRKTTPEKYEISYDCELSLNGKKRWFRIVARAMWQSVEPPVCSGFIGKAFDIHDSVMKLNDLEKKASTDALTGILNHAGAKELIKKRLSDTTGRKFALAIFDLDRFKQANDTYGHMFGDKVLVHTAKMLCHSIRNSDIMARVGGDEFLIFLEYKTDIEQIIKRIFRTISGKYEDFQISLSMGIATNDIIGNDYDALFSAADKALYMTKREGSGSYHFYDDSVHEIFSVISPIDG